MLDFWTQFCWHSKCPKISLIVLLINVYRDNLLKSTPCYLLEKGFCVNKKMNFGKFCQQNSFVLQIAWWQSRKNIFLQYSLKLGKSSQFWNIFGNSSLFPPTSFYTNSWHTLHCIWKAIDRFSREKIVTVVEANICALNWKMSLYCFNQKVSGNRDGITIDRKWQFQDSWFAFLSSTQGNMKTRTIVAEFCDVMLSQ